MLLSVTVPTVTELAICVVAHINALRLSIIVQFTVFLADTFRLVEKSYWRLVAASTFSLKFRAVTVIEHILRSCLF